MYNALIDGMAPAARWSWLVIAMAGCLMATAAQAQVTRVSVTSVGGEANGASRTVAVSADSQLVAFSSLADNLVPNDTNGVEDVFVKDRVSGVVIRVSVGTGGTQADAASTEPSLSDDGRFVTFTSRAALVAADTNVCTPSADCADVYVHDMTTGETALVSLAPGGTPAAMGGHGARISGSGRFVVFSSPSADLAAEAPGVRIFIRDRQDAVTTQLVVQNAAAASEGVVGGVSTDGSVITFGASSRVLPSAADAYTCTAAAAGCQRVYIYTRVDGETMRLDEMNASELTRSMEATPLGLSGDGRVVLIASTPDVTYNQPSSLVTTYDRLEGSRRGLGGDSTGVPAAAAISRDGRLVTLCKVQGSARFIAALDLATKIPETLFSFAGAAPCATTMALSGDGMVLFLASDNAALVSPDLNGASDVFAIDRDQDHDGMPDEWERRFGFDPTTAGAPMADADGDGVTDVDEFRRASHPKGFFRRYFAEGAANTFFRTALDVFNPGPTATSTLITYLGGNGLTSSQFTFLPVNAHWMGNPYAGGGEGGDADGLYGAQQPLDTVFSTILESDHPIVAERTMTWDIRGYGSHGETAIEAPGLEWHFAEGATGVHSLYYLLQNPNETPAHVDIKYLRPSPAAPITIGYDVAPHSRKTIDVNSQPGLAATEVAAVLTSDLPVLAERAQYRSWHDEFWAAGLGGAAVPAPAFEWFVAEGATGFFSLYLVAGNPNGSAAELTVTYLLPDGTSFDKPYRIEKESRLTIDVAGEDPRLLSTSVGMTVRSTNSVPVVVERVMWWPRADPYEASVAAGATSTATDWAAASVPVDGYGISQSYLLVANPSAQAGKVTITLISTDTTCTATYDLLAHSRLTVDALDVCLATGGPQLGEVTFAATVRSNGPSIVVERASYRTELVGNKKGRLWSAGVAVPLTRIAPVVP